MTYAEALPTMPELRGPNATVALARRMRQWHAAERAGVLEKALRYFEERADSKFWLESDTNEFAELLRGE